MGIECPHKNLLNNVAVVMIWGSHGAIAPHESSLFPERSDLAPKLQHAS